MTEQIQIPYNDIFFYGVYLQSREPEDVSKDIFANIIMRYLRTLEPVQNRLYRTVGKDRYEYSYSFIPSKRLSWRVIKNRRVIEDIEYLSDGKYCLNYYDENGKDIKRVFFSERHAWLKTNYYNSVGADTLLCSIVPKEINGETAILLYTTGVQYPTTYYCCKQPACETVRDRILARVPLPGVSALTNYGLMYFAAEQTLNIYNQVLAEEEKKYALENKPPVYTTEEDMAGGFNFTKESFSEKGAGLFSLSEAKELDGNISDFINDEKSPELEQKAEPEQKTEYIETVPETEEFSLERRLAEAISFIERETSIRVDESLVLDSKEEPETETDISPMNEIKEETSVPDDISVPKASNESEDKPVLSELPEAEKAADSEKTSETSSEGELFDFSEDDMDDYVKSLIDSLLINAKSAVNEYSKGSTDNFAENGEQRDCKENLEVYESELKSTENTPRKEIESGDEKYYYYGEYDEVTGRNGRGKTLMENSLTAYEGDYLCDMRHGKGSFYYRSGDLCYYGDWAKNMRQGFGLGISSDTGIAHVGKWDSNKPCGVGARFDRNGNFLYLDSHSERVNGGIRVTGFTENSVLIEYWDEKSLKTIKKEIFIHE